MSCSCAILTPMVMVAALRRAASEDLGRSGDSLALSSSPQATIRGMSKHRQARAIAGRRKRAVTLQNLSTIKANSISLCRRQTSRPPAKKHRGNQRPESAQVTKHGAAWLSPCTRHFVQRASLESRAPWSRKFRFQQRLATQQKNQKSSIAALLLPVWT